MLNDLPNFIAKSESVVNGLETILVDLAGSFESGSHSFDRDIFKFFLDAFTATDRLVLNVDFNCIIFSSVRNWRFLALHSVRPDGQAERAALRS